MSKPKIVPFAAEGASGPELFAATHGDGFTVVRAEEVEDRARRGWTLSLVVDAQDFVSPKCLVCSGSTQYNAPSIISRPWFVMVRSKDLEVAEVRSELGEVTDSCDKLARELIELRAAAIQVETERNHARDATGAAERETFLANRRSADAEARARVLEADLAAVRREIGDREYARIVGARRA